VAKLTDFQTPTGQAGNLFDLTSWTKGILGVLFLFITFGIGQRLAQKLDGKGPFDTSIEQPWKSPSVPVPSVLQEQPYKFV
jgi:hypothetical protein